MWRTCSLLSDRYPFPQPIKDAALGLTNISPATRYPGYADDITVEQAESAEVQSAQIVDWVRSVSP